MQIAADVTTSSSLSGAGMPESADRPASDSPLSQLRIIRRNGAVVGFEPAKISVAMTKAFIAVNGGQGAASARIRELVAALTDTVVRALIRRQPGGGTFHIEDIQDQVELALMRSGEHEVARAYVLYREKRAGERAQEAAQKKATAPVQQLSVLENGTRSPLDLDRLSGLIGDSCEGLLY
jgi:ribonucleoside-diphosphate reductase alpha chain